MATDTGRGMACFGFHYDAFIRIQMVTSPPAAYLRLSSTIYAISDESQVKTREVGCDIGGVFFFGKRSAYRPGFIAVLGADFFATVSCRNGSLDPATGAGQFIHGVNGCIEGMPLIDPRRRHGEEWTRMSCDTVCSERHRYDPHNLFCHTFWLLNVNGEMLERLDLKLVAEGHLGRLS